VRGNPEKIRKRTFFDMGWKKGMSLADIEIEWEVDAIIIV
jgi:hypothetical protein